MKKFMKFLVALIAITTGLTACQQKSVMTSNAEQEYRIEKVAPFFYKVHFTDYNFDSCRNFTNKRTQNGAGLNLFGCSEVRYGNTVGRNLDWYINYQAGGVIWVDHKDKVDNDLAATLLNRKERYSSVAMIGSDPNFIVDTLNTLKAKGEDIERLPFSTTDGINEKGVYIGVNVAPAGETSENPNNWHPDEWGHGAAYTQKDKLSGDSTQNAMCVTYLTRIILDHARNVTDAIEIIKSLNWYEPKTKKADGSYKCQALHWLICDKYSSAVVEFIDNKVQFVPENNTHKISLGSAMTNFSNCIYDEHNKKRIQHGGCGYERYNSIFHYFQSKHDVRLIMEALHYSNFYHKYYTDCEGDYMRYKFPTEHHHADTLKSDWLYPKIKEGYEEKFRDALNRECTHWPESKKAAEVRKDTAMINKYWYTTHTSIYDIANKSFKVLIHEGFDEIDYDCNSSDKTKYYYQVSFYKPFEVTRVK